MESLAYLFRLSTAGLFLDTNTFREQRDNPAALRDGFLVVALVGIVVGVASLIGNVLSALASPDPQAILDIVQRSIERTPFFIELQRANPTINLDPFFIQLSEIVGSTRWSGLIGAVATPFVYLAGWLIYGAVAHLAARSLGGEGTLAQTLGCTALASGANLLAVVQIVPFAQAAGTTLLGLIGCYLGLRAAHNLSAWRAFWAALVGPIILILLLLVMSCGALAVLVAALRGN
ncbi:Yip1 family protein [Chloroflexus sp.]|uniref:Yip1 family protein n=1 Tax=Chloroflexus sp. TaxID=1904827 RepID=UPI00298EEB06|nr:Yip1 family protein [Chloroflexus sp.]MCS6888524.1 YIP1 family protein [Chloroflexus sp.]MDW8405334.1 Yip1 family protein [Chloroflexus sp.]